MLLDGHFAPRDSLKAVLFDLDNTLYDRDLTFRKWATGFVARHFGRTTAAERQAILDQMLVLDDCGLTTRPALFRQIKQLYPHLADDVETLCGHFYNGFPAYMTLDASTRCLLDALDRAHIPFGIVTNASHHQIHRIRQVGLHTRTRCIFISEVFGCRKPAAAIFEAAAACLNVPCRAVLFVGDNPESDICGARAVGMTTAWLHRGRPWPEDLTGIAPDFVLASLGELMEILPLQP